MVTAGPLDVSVSARSLVTPTEIIFERVIISYTSSYAIRQPLKVKAALRLFSEARKG